MVYCTLYNTHSPTPSHLSVLLSLGLERLISNGVTCHYDPDNVGTELLVLQSSQLPCYVIDHHLDTQLVRPRGAKVET